MAWRMFNAASKAAVGLVVVGAALAAGATGGCAAGCDGTSWSGSQTWVKGTRNLSAASEAGMGLAVEAANGRIEISASSGTEVKVQAEVRASTAERLEATVVKAERGADGDLRVWAEWPGGKRLSSEGVSFVLEVPGETSGKIRANTSNGALEFNGLSGALVATTSNGAVRVHDHRGAVNVRSSNGAVTVEGATGAVTIATSNGSVKARLAAASAGDAATERVVDISTSNGAVVLGLPADFTGELAIDTSNGRITTPPGAEVVSKGSKTSTRVRFGGQAGPVSKIRTSNGSVTVE